jgi:hypothetical protein
MEVTVIQQILAYAIIVVFVKLNLLVKIALPILIHVIQIHV